MNAATETTALPQRGTRMTRLDVFTDAAFAFAAAMLAISIDEVPSSYAELVEAMKGAPAFAASLGILLLFWRAHQNWSRRYGLDDLPSVLLTFSLILVVMLYVYPLKLMFLGAFSFITNGLLPARFELMHVDEFRGLLTIYGLGFFLMAWLIGGLYAHAWRLRHRLAMAEAEAFDTGCEAVAWWIVGSFGLWSILLAWLLHERHIAFAAWIYSALAVIGPAIAWVQLRMARRRGLN